MSEAVILPQITRRTPISIQKVASGFLYSFTVTLDNGETREIVSTGWDTAEHADRDAQIASLRLIDRGWDGD